MVRGAADMVLGEDSVALGVGSSIRIPPSTRLKYRTTSEEPFEAVGVTTPPWAGDDDAVAADDYWR